MAAIYKKQIFKYGLTIYSAIQPDCSHEIQVLIWTGDLAAGIITEPVPIKDNRQEIDLAEFARAFNLATSFFSDFLKTGPNYLGQ